MNIRYPENVGVKNGKPYKYMIVK